MPPSFTGKPVSAGKTNTEKHVRVGIDIIEVSRIQTTLESWGERFTQRVFTPAELAYCRGRAPSLAARFAAKEAAAKALGTGIGQVEWREIEILSDTTGAPALQFHGRALARATELGVQQWEVSFSHSRDYAVAVVIMT
ncbi:MAG: holo-[acyl-carrier-protein] synthase [Chloroflexi bacterium]|nr:holo-[acyl-carrier-protein] synthase [Chloroflexota bacterium]